MGDLCGKREYHITYVDHDMSSVSKFSCDPV